MRMKPLNVSAPKAAQYAVMLYSEPRWTKDLDLWIALDLPNANPHISHPIGAQGGQTSQDDCYAG